ncbi:MAG: hypothetical protein KKF10_06495, partial [Verrucomicrobia bacterium]|nr:hypothetical protein [Verrucomicrobiota bacterium]
FHQLAHQEERRRRIEVIEMPTNRLQRSDDLSHRRLAIGLLFENIRFGVESKNQGFYVVVS